MHILSLPQPFHRIPTLHPAYGSKFSCILRPQQMLDLVKYLPRKIPARLNFFTFNWVFSFYWGLLDKVLPTDNPGISKIPASVSEPLITGYFVTLFPCFSTIFLSMIVPISGWKLFSQRQMKTYGVKKYHLDAGKL